MDLLCFDFILIKSDNHVEVRGLHSKKAKIVGLALLISQIMFQTKPLPLSPVSLEPFIKDH